MCRDIKEHAKKSNIKWIPVENRSKSKEGRLGTAVCTYVLLFQQTKLVLKGVLDICVLCVLPVLGE